MNFSNPTIKCAFAQLKPQKVVWIGLRQMSPSGRFAAVDLVNLCGFGKSSLIIPFQLRTPFTALLDEDLEEILRISGFDLGGYRVSFKILTKCRKTYTALHMYRAIGNNPQDALARHSSRRTILLKHLAGTPMFVAQKIKQSVIKNRTQTLKQKKTPDAVIYGENLLLWSSCVASYIQITDKDDGSVCPSLSCDARRCTAK